MVSTLRSGVASVWVNVGGGEGEEKRWYTRWKEERRHKQERVSVRRAEEGNEENEGERE